MKRQEEKVTSSQNKSHRKHGAITRPALGEFHRNELAILGTPCKNIQQLVHQIIDTLAARWRIAYVDADHKAEAPAADTALAHGAAMEFTDQINSRKVIYQQQFNNFENRALFNNQDLVLVNGNHFRAHSQIIVIDDAKPLYKKLDRLTDVKLVLYTSGNQLLPAEVLNYNPALARVPALPINDTAAIAAFIEQYLQQRLPPVYGLVLAGGKSTRMETDKGSISYYGKSQRVHTYELLSTLTEAAYVSYADEQSVNPKEGLPYITDKFLGLGPLSGILSAFQQKPDGAWLTVACDLPYLSAATLQYLVQHRNPSKMATAFIDPEGKFPEPLITLWEPRAYPVLLSFLSQGYDCPRKALINSAIELLHAPQVQDLQNINHPQERDEVIKRLSVTL